MAEKTALPNTTESGSPRATGTVAASLAAVASVLAASICCLPLIPFMMAAGLAGTLLHFSLRFGRISWSARFSSSLWVSIKRGARENAIVGQARSPRSCYGYRRRSC